MLLGNPEPLPYLARAVSNNPADDSPGAVLFAELAGAVPIIAGLEHDSAVANAVFAGRADRCSPFQRRERRASGPFQAAPRAR